MTGTEPTTDSRRGPYSTAQVPVRALVLVPDIGRSERRQAGDRLVEAIGLAEAIDLEVVDGLVVPVPRIRPATLFGTGKIDELLARVKGDDIDLTVVDGELSPVQQRNLEKALGCKVVDRTGLILEIFGKRARTREGTLQVELAHLTYQKSRLVRSWTHLERQRGGFGFLGGPGETQIEADRRMIEGRVKRISAELDSVAIRRRLQRQNRQRNSQPTIALVGYTNAGKSTLFNALTNSGVSAHDQLFATLDPTLRRIDLPGGTAAVLSDTVGFVADLPTTLIAAFRATLEEVAEADIILHVRDAANPNAAGQAEDVRAVLLELGIDLDDSDRIVEVWNKIDLLPDDRRPFGNGANGNDSGGVAVSAVTGEGLDRLLDVLATRIDRDQQTFRILLVGERMAHLHRLYELGEVVERVNDEEKGAVSLRVRVASSAVAGLRREFPEARCA